MIVFHLCKLIFRWSARTELKAFCSWSSLLAVSEEIAEVEQPGFPQTAALEHQGDEAALHLSPNSPGLHSEHQDTNNPPWKPAIIIHV